MKNEELKIYISQSFAPVTYDETGEFLTLIIPHDELYPVMNTLRHDQELRFDYLFCLTCVDWKDHLMMVYHLLSKTHGHTLVVKAKITDLVRPRIESVASIWKTAELHEDEVFDLFGVTFLNHPNLRRLFLEEDWNGFPLRKNYEDENMIRL
jgi:NADH:ubiquinone oxidoreductase subunit C